MVTFNKNAQNYTITLPGNEEDYFSLMRSIANILSNADTSVVEKETIYDISKLLQNMMPDPSQKVTMIIK